MDTPVIIYLRLSQHCHLEIRNYTEISYFKLLQLQVVSATIAATKRAMNTTMRSQETAVWPEMHVKYHTLTILHGESKANPRNELL